MAGSLAEEVGATRREIDQISSGLDEAIRKIQAEAAQAVVDLVRGSSERRAALLVRLSFLEAAASAAGVSEPETAKPKLTAADAILTALADGKLKANQVDQAVMAQGLSKASAEKAKWNCVKNGWVTHAKRVWTITPTGLRKIRGQDPPSET